MAKYLLGGKLKYFIEDINRFTELYDITGSLYCVFLSCCSIDSRQFRIFDVADMKWGTRKLSDRFPGIINSMNYQYYSTNPDKLYNLLYRGKNGNKSEGDGWLYRPRGIIKVACRNAYEELNYYLGKSMENPDILGIDYEYMIKAACVHFNLNLKSKQYGEIWASMINTMCSLQHFINIIKFYEKIYEKSGSDSHGYSRSDNN